MNKKIFLTAALMLLTACGQAAENMDTVTDTATETAASAETTTASESETTVAATSETTTVKTTAKTTVKTTVKTTAETTTETSAETTEETTAETSRAAATEPVDFKTYDDRVSEGFESYNVLNIKDVSDLPDDYYEYRFSVKWDGREELTEKLINARFVFSVLFSWGQWTFDDRALWQEDKVVVNDYCCYKTGINYDSFYSYLTSVFTPEFAEFLKNEGEFADVDGELYGIVFETGINPAYCCQSFEIVDETDEKITLRFISDYYNMDTGDPHYVSGGFEFDVFKTPEGLRINDFDFPDYYHFHKNYWE